MAADLNTEAGTFELEPSQLPPGHRKSAVFCDTTERGFRIMDVRSGSEAEVQAPPQGDDCSQWLRNRQPPRNIYKPARSFIRGALWFCTVLAPQPHSGASLHCCRDVGNAGELNFARFYLQDAKIFVFH